jgi:PadR family transcriptional regulator, regulatory protein PadR
MHNAGVDPNDGYEPDRQQQATNDAVVLPLIDAIVLALVIEKPSYGYEIHQRIMRRFSEILSTSQSNVYDVLRRLEAAGYVVLAGHSGARGRPRVNFHATDQGTEIHLSWLAECLCDPQRSAILSRLASTGLRGTDTKLKLIDRFMEMSSREAREVPMPECDDGLLLDLLIELRRRMADAKLEWGVYARGLVLDRAAGGPREGVG